MGDDRLGHVLEVVRRQVVVVRAHEPFEEPPGSTTGETESLDVGSIPHVESVVTVRRETSTLRLEPGDFAVRTDQPLGTLAAYLLEPESDDGLTRWNFFESALQPGSLRPGAFHPVSRIEAGANLPPLRPY